MKKVKVILSVNDESGIVSEFAEANNRDEKDVNLLDAVDANIRGTLEFAAT